MTASLGQPPAPGGPAAAKAPPPSDRDPIRRWLARPPPPPGDGGGIIARARPAPKWARWGGLWGCMGERRVARDARGMWRRARGETSCVFARPGPVRGAPTSARGGDETVRARTAPGRARSNKRAFSYQSVTRAVLLCRHRSPTAMLRAARRRSSPPPMIECVQPRRQQRP
eukprot:scaffold7460_cov430-Prasinococcus_capsulatus_cf.AAC.3